MVLQLVFVVWQEEGRGMLTLVFVAIFDSHAEVSGSRLFFKVFLFSKLVHRGCGCNVRCMFATVVPSWFAIHLFSASEAVSSLHQHYMESTATITLLVHLVARDIPLQKRKTVE